MQTLLLCSILLFGNPSPDDTLTVSSSVNEATVYLSGAEISRKVSFKVQPGDNNITFTGLSTTFDERSIRLSTPSDIVLRSLTKSTGKTKQTPYSDEFSALKDQKKKIERQIDQQQAKLRVLNRQLKMLTANQDIGGERSSLSTSQLQRALEYFQRKFTELESDKIEVSNELQEQQKSLREIDKKIAKLESRQRRASGALEAVIHSDRRQRLTVQLSYFVPSARWVPSYDIRVEEIDQPIDLRYTANIYQNTGIDWNNVNLTVSSAQPRSGSKLPDLSPTYLGFYEPRPLSKIELDAGVYREEAQNVIQTKQQNMPPPPPVQVQLQEQSTAFSFQIKEPYSISSGNNAKSVAIKSHSLPASYRYFAIPKKQQTAFLRANVTGWDGLHLLSGKANLFLDQAFVGKTNLNFDAVRDTLSVSLGRDKSIVIERTQIEDFKEKNFFGNKVTQTKGWNIRIRNTKSRAVDMVIADQVPLSSNEKITVDLKERSGASFDASTGRLEWSINIPANTAKELSFVYEIEYPDGKLLQTKQ